MDTIVDVCEECIIKSCCSRVCADFRKLLLLKYKIVFGQTYGKLSLNLAIDICKIIFNLTRKERECPSNFDGVLYTSVGNYPIVIEDIYISPSILTRVSFRCSWKDSYAQC